MNNLYIAEMQLKWRLEELHKQREQRPSSDQGRSAGRTEREARWAPGALGAVRRLLVRP
jgi:hypothetical protein